MLTIEEVQNYSISNIEMFQEAMETLQAALVVVEKAKELKREMENPAPDIALRTKYRSELFDLLNPFQKVECPMGMKCLPGHPTCPTCQKGEK